jgi:hypothetical protein
MKYLALFTLGLLAACASSAPSPQQRVIPAGPAPERIDYGFDRGAIEHDLLATARTRFGEAAVRQAFGASTYLLAKHYPGRLPPPPPGAGADWRYPDPPMAMLIKLDGSWFAAGPAGFQPAHAEAVAGIEALLADKTFWAEPEWGKPGCTHHGARLFMLKVPRRAEIIRRGVCGPAPLGERLVFHALASLR